MPLTSFMPGPTYDAFTPGEFMQQAFDQPFSMSETLGQRAVGAVENSFGVGTAIRAGTSDQGRGFVPLDDQSREPPTDLSQPQIRQETDAEVAARGDQTLNQDQYKSSSYYRPQIPWDESMTANRAKDLAQYADVQAVRNEMARRRPWTAMAGDFIGTALDPINYVPVLGEGAEAASVARFGVVGGRALVGAGDAALNVGIAGLLTAPIRQQFGDDISWQSQVSQMAMGAALGAGFSALGGVFKARADARAEAVRTELENNLSTIRNGQDAMATLHEAVAGLANDGEVNLGEGSLDRLDNLHGDMADTLSNIDARTTVAETPAAYAERILGETMPEDMQRLSEIDRAIDINSNELDSLRSENMDNERFGSTRATFIDAKQLDEKYQQLQAATDKANSDKQRTQLQKQVDAVQARVQAIFDKLDPATVDRLEHLEQSIPLREKALADARAARDPLAAKIEAARQGHIKEYLGRLGEAAPQLETVKDFERTPTTTALKANIDTPSEQWAPQSVARDENGQLVSVYHGTVNKFEHFDPERLGEETGAGSAKEGFFFTENKDVAAGYADGFNEYRDTALGRILQKLTGGGFKHFSEAVLKLFGKSAIEDGRVVKANLDVRNPLVVDYHGKEIKESEVAGILKKAKEDGHDAVHFKNISDPGYTKASEAAADNWVVFDPKQIKIVDHGDPELNLKLANEAEAGRRMEAEKQSLINRYAAAGDRTADRGGTSDATPRVSSDVVATKAVPETAPPEAVKAAAEVAKPDTLKKVAEANSVNAETGEFPEQAHLDQLEKEGRMTEEDHTAMQIANDNFKAAKSWGEALKAAVACLI